MKYSWKGHEDINRHKNRIKRSGQALYVYVKNINHNIPTIKRWAGGDVERESAWVSSLKVREMAIVNQTNIGKMFQKQCWGTLERPDGAHMGFPQARRYQYELNSWLRHHIFTSSALVNHLHATVVHHSWQWNTSCRTVRITRTWEQKPGLLTHR